MHEYELYNPTTNETTTTFGYWEADMWRRNPSLNPDDWKILRTEYVD